MWTHCAQSFGRCSVFRVSYGLLPAMPAGGLPNSWGNLTSLNHLRITNAPNITGSIPSTWSNVTRLQLLELVNVSVAGRLPAGWAAGMPALTQLSLQRMPQLLLPNSSISTWLTNSSLTHLELRQLGGMSGVALDPGLAGAYPNLKVLALSWLGLTGPLPASWQALGGSSKLQMLDLAGNALSGQLPQWLVSVMGGTDAAIMLNLNTFTGV
eukprot:GHRQ01017429.1.p1 GENE.GHRQ01017429.1~~GHRQ01017429.1.p1  ORF type:complete len:211 (+),score=47.31 GHRQ01017429.1:215-847(+)